MTVNGKRASLGAAKGAKNDEFYTQWSDIEKEMNAYLEYNPDVFRGKKVFLPCDDPEWSNFTKYFAERFDELGLKKLVSTSYAPDSNPAVKSYSPTLFELDTPQFDATKTRQNGKKFVLEATDTNNDGRIDFDDLTWEYLEGDGDFQSEEVTKLRDEADFVITNPPFSLFRSFMEWLIKGGQKFSIIGNSNAITYKEVYPLIKQNILWLGATRDGNGSMWFRIPDDAPFKATGQKTEDGIRYQTVGNSAWFTNIDHGRRHEPLQLMTEKDNIRYSKHDSVKGVGYEKYANEDAIEIPRLDAIPSDYSGLMGVPITFVGKYNPDQFEIVRFRYGSDGKDLRLPSGKVPYFRILIRHRNNSTPGAPS
ncbi:adenine-specific methyltransferase EcoRI family protein [Corynebacterium variabile]|uniref:adenine-specific methyltransferase EcoRI family protein n=1 Tax=Corynebacterium variabile TaxID=1727 RepID=UPI003BB1F883